MFPRVVGLPFKKVLDRLNTSPVQCEPTRLTVFFFVDFDGIPRFKISDLVNPKPKQGFFAQTLKMYEKEIF